MRIPQTLEQWCEDGLIDEVVGALKTGKEADVFLVEYRGELCAAKVYKDREARSFKNRSPYTEGRKVRSSRLERAMSKGSKFGHSTEEAAWKSAEVDALYALHRAGVRVPEPLMFSEGILVMRLVVDAEGAPAPRLAELEFSETEALNLHRTLIRIIADILAEGYVHADLSAFNVLMAADGPTVIDLPQVVSAAHNRQAPQLLTRDIESITQGLIRFNPGLDDPARWGATLWRLYETGELRAGMALKLDPLPHEQKGVDLGALPRELRDVEKEKAAMDQVRTPQDPTRGIVPPMVR